MTTAAVATPLLLLALAVAAPAAETGWKRIDLADGGYANRYLPKSVDQAQPVPVVVFFHGSGVAPEAYQPAIEGGAEAAKIMLLMPRSRSGDGWNDADIAPMNQALTALEAEVPVDHDRIALAGHSAGAAFSYLVAYGQRARICAVFTVNAPFYTVKTLADPDYIAPIRMYYGGSDPFYAGGAAGGSYARLIAQWEGFHVPHTEEIVPGLGHGDLNPPSFAAGLAFLAEHRYAAAQAPVAATQAPVKAGPRADAKTTDVKKAEAKKAPAGR